MTGPSPLATALNAAIGLDLASFSQAREWLNDGGWERLEEWLAAHRDDGEGRA